jgi:hypothetical protein
MQKTTFFDLLNKTPGVTNLYDTLGPELIHNLRRSKSKYKRCSRK